jgi:hypothetical protein
MIIHDDEQDTAAVRALLGNRQVHKIAYVVRMTNLAETTRRTDFFDQPPPHRQFTEWL